MLFETIAETGHEQIVYCHSKDAGLKAIIAIHNSVLGPALELLRPLPIPAVIPPLIVLLGIDDPMKVTVVAITAFFPLLINTTQGLQSIDPVLLGVARTFRLGGIARTARIIVPATLPAVHSTRPPSAPASSISRRTRVIISSRVPLRSVNGGIWPSMTDFGIARRISAGRMLGPRFTAFTPRSLRMPIRCPMSLSEC